jgi:putative endonuclease
VGDAELHNLSGASAKRRGDFGEAVAADFLRSKGFQISALRYRSRYGEIDIIAADSDYIVFAEVKTRRSSKFGTPAQYVGSLKQARIRVTAELWLQSHPEESRQPRFDIVEVYTDRSPPGVRWLVNAFS